MSRSRQNSLENLKIRINWRKVGDRLEFYHGDYLPKRSHKMSLRNKRMQKLLKYEEENSQNFSTNPGFAYEEKVNNFEDTYGTSSNDEDNWRKDLKLEKRDFSFGDISNQPFSGFNFKQEAKDLQTIPSLEKSDFGQTANFSEVQMEPRSLNSDSKKLNEENQLLKHKLYKPIPVRKMVKATKDISTQVYSKFPKRIPILKYAPKNKEIGNHCGWCKKWINFLNKNTFVYRPYLG